MDTDIFSFILIGCIKLEILLQDENTNINKWSMLNNCMKLAKHFYTRSMSKKIVKYS